MAGAGHSRRKTIKGERKFQPAQVLAISFVIGILTGTGLLLMPMSTVQGSISPVDALFTATSAVCVTGLIVQDTPTYFTLAGQVVILMLVQLGGLGIMTFSTLVLLVAGRKISIKDRLAVQEGYYPGAPRDFKSLLTSVFFYTLIIELLGCLMFFLRFQKDHSFFSALYLSLFHSVSAFCNAGFSLFSDSFVDYRGDAWINATLILLIVFGGLGFLVIHEGRDVLRSFIRRKKFHVSLHAKLVVFMTFLLIVIPFLVFFWIEEHQALEGVSGKEKALSALFQVVTARTAGFNTMDLQSLGTASVFLLVLLMFVGASPGSTGGGVKTTTVAVILAFLKSRIQARESVGLFYRSLPAETVTKSYTLISLALCCIFISSFVLFLNQPWMEMKEILLEVFSAFGTVGLSLGITPRLTPLSKTMIILTMYVGRIGPLVLLYAISRRRPFGHYDYVEENVMVG